MRRRVAPKLSSQLDNFPKVRIIKVSEPTRLITLESPDDDVQQASGAFVRLKPPDGLPQNQIDSWRRQVAKVAKAVKVLSSRYDADVPTDSIRTEKGEKIGTVRQEAILLAKETKNAKVLKLVTEILDQVGCP